MSALEIGSVRYMHYPKPVARECQHLARIPDLRSRKSTGRFGLDSGYARGSENCRRIVDCGYLRALTETRFNGIN